LHDPPGKAKYPHPFEFNKLAHYEILLGTYIDYNPKTIGASSFEVSRQNHSQIS
jgi:hypothetical protein